MSVSYDGTGDAASAWFAVVFAVGVCLLLWFSYTEGFNNAEQIGLKEFEKCKTGFAECIEGKELIDQLTLQAQDEKRRQVQQGLDGSSPPVWLIGVDYNYESGRFYYRADLDKMFYFNGEELIDLTDQIKNGID